MAKGIWGRGMDWMLDLVWGDAKGRAADLEEKSYTLGEAPSSSLGRSSGGGGSAKRDPALSIIKKIGLSIISGGGTAGRDYEPPEFDFQSITDAYDTEGYVRQALDKYTETIFKAGWNFVGKNPASVEYIQTRFKLMAESTQIPTQILFVEIFEDLVKYSNTIVAKARAKDQLPFQGLNVMGVGDNMPVAGYFPLNVSTMSVRRDKNGVIRGWRQEVDGQDKPVNFKPQDVVHMYYKREKGRAFGTPFMLPALDDVRALRQMEENILRLVYRNLHPLWHIKVGSQEEGQGADPEEVTVVQNEVQNMDVEGGFVTNERVDIKAIAANQIIDAKDYLKHFELRTFSVMGVSELMMGRGDSANRSTGDNISSEFTDRCKAFQKIGSTFINDMMINELLLEGGFDPIFNPDDQVYFVFNEIDKDSQIKHENHAVFLYEHNAINEDEMRELISRDPIEDGEQRSKMHLELITIRTLAETAALAPAPASGGGTGGTAAKPSTGGSKATDNRNKPTNQHGTKTSPKKATNSSLEMMVFREYTQLNDAALAVLFMHYAENESIDKLTQVFKYTENATLEAIKHQLDEASMYRSELAIKRMFKAMQETILESVNSLESDISYAAAREVTQAIFDVYTDRLSDIIETLVANSTQEEDDMNE